MSGIEAKDFPKNFLWGAATSAHQIEGHNDKNDWWQWELDGRTEGGAKSGAATDHLNRYAEDLKLAASLGLTSYRFSIEWSRIEPERGRFDAKAIAWYRDLILECEKNNLLPMCTLHHFTSPMWFAKEGGFSRPGSHSDFIRFVQVVVNELGNRIPLWCTLNEPNVLVVGTYLAKFMPPGIISPKGAGQACHELLKSHVLAYDLIRESSSRKREGPWKEHPVQVGIAINWMDFLPDRWWHPIEHLIARKFSGFYNLAWLDAVLGNSQDFGFINVVADPPDVLDAVGRRTVDFVGINYYTKAYIQWKPRDRSGEQLAELPLPLGIAFARRKEPVSDMGWAIHPKGFAKAIRYVHAAMGEVKIPIHITENGIADREDWIRPWYIMEHLRVILEAIEDGILVQSYYYWSLLDNFEWSKGFGPRFGLFHVNYETFERKKTGSAEWLKRFLMVR